MKLKNIPFNTEFDLEDLAPAFNPTTAYRTGNVCMYNGKAWSYVGPDGVAEPWTEMNWSKIYPAAEFGKPSVQMGQKSTVGERGVSLGASTTTGSYSVAVGASATADANNAIAIGSFAEATANSSVALGYSANASGESATALGKVAIASGESAVALGSSQATGPRSVSIGNNAKATKESCIAIGCEGTKANCVCLPTADKIYIGDKTLEELLA